MNENRRLQYLEAIGIDNYVPRWLLPNAPAPQLCELAQPLIETQVAQVETEVFSGEDLPNVSVDQLEKVAKPVSGPSADVGQISGEAIASINKNLASVLEDLSGTAPRARSVSSADEVPVEHKADAVETPAAESPVVEKAAFHLGLWFTDTAIQVVDSRKADDALPTAALLSNILVACGLIKTNLPAMETQVWPFPGTPEKDQGWDAACAMMSDFFQFRFEAKAARTMILCGEEAAKSVLGPSVDYDALLFKSLPINQLELDALVLPALRDFLYHPELKSSLWRALSQLRDH